jgi:hypothetical protein
MSLKAKNVAAVTLVTGSGRRVTLGAAKFSQQERTVKAPPRNGKTITRTIARAAVDEVHHTKKRAIA